MLCNLPQRPLGKHNVSAISLGCMNLSHAYGHPPTPAAGKHLIRQAYDWGVNHFDTAILYGFGRNEELVGNAIKPFRQNVHLASKCGLTTPDMQRGIDARPEVIRQACDDSLRRLQTDFIDLYYLHRLDPNVPIEDSIGALRDLVIAGKIGSIGLSEVSADTIRRAHRIHPITAVQSEYSLWARNPEIAVLTCCQALNITFVAFSPLARGFLTGQLADPESFPEKDIRRNMPRFHHPHFNTNLQLLARLKDMAKHYNCSMTQLALSWLLHKGEHIIPIPGTTQLSHLEENLNAASVKISERDMAILDSHFNPKAISGPRYNDKTLQEIDTERWDHE